MAGAVHFHVSHDSPSRRGLWVFIEIEAIFHAIKDDYRGNVTDARGVLAAGKPVTSFIYDKTAAPTCMLEYKIRICKSYIKVGLILPSYKSQHHCPQPLAAV